MEISIEADVSKRPTNNSLMQAEAMVMKKAPTKIVAAVMGLANSPNHAFNHPAAPCGKCSGNVCDRHSNNPVASRQRKEMAQRMMRNMPSKLQIKVAGLQWQGGARSS